MRACSTPAMKKRRKSLLVSEETFHQKLSMAGPLAVVCMELEPLFPTAPLRAASTPSCVTRGWPTQTGLPTVVQLQVGISSASTRGRTGVTVKTATTLVALPDEFVTNTE